MMLVIRDENRPTRGRFVREREEQGDVADRALITWLIMH